MITKRRTIKTTEVDVLDAQWVRAMWVNAIGTKNFHPDTPRTHICCPHL